MLDDFMRITRALSDPGRVRMLLTLRGGELCVCQITEVLGLAPSTISKHLSILGHAGLVVSRKDGRWIHYALAGKGAPAVVREAIGWVSKSLGRGPSAAADARRLGRVLKMDPVKLCKRQCKR